MDAGEEHSTRRRSLNACIRCRRHKTKCGGKIPCDPCKRRRVTCHYEVDEAKVTVSKRYLAELQAKLAALESHQQRSPSVSPAYLQGPTPMSQGQDEGTCITNPVLSPGYLTHITGPEGRPHFLGHSSNYSYTQRALRLLHSRFSQDPYPTWHPYDLSNLGYGRLRTPVESALETLPSIDHAVFLLNAVKFHAGQIYHLFDEATFMPQLYQFYNDPAEGIDKMSLWYIHFLVLIAFGKAFTTCDGQESKPPGSDLFVRAAHLLPEPSHLIHDSATGTEILSCMALYYLALDSRIMAYDKIGQGIRLGITAGMHTAMQPESNDTDLIQRCRKSWWTMIVLDRQISSLQGLLIQVQDDDIAAPLPVFSDSEQRTAAMEIQVGLSRAISQVVNSVYRRDVAGNPSFVSRTQQALRNVAHVASGLTTHFSLPTAGSCGGISRIAGQLNIFYHQCIVVATRPFLFVFLEKRLSSSEEEAAAFFWKDPIRHILMIGIESAKKISGILSSLKDQHLIESFLPFELESAFSAGTYLSIAEANFPSLVNDGPWLQTIIDALQIMVSKGNVAAKGRLSELEHLRQMLGEAGQLLSCEATRTQTQTQRPQTATPSTDATTIVVVTARDFGGQVGGSEIVESEPAIEGSVAVGTDLLDWVERANAEESYSQPGHLTAIAESLDTWDSTDWFTTLSLDM